MTLLAQSIKWRTVAAYAVCSQHLSKQPWFTVEWMDFPGRKTQHHCNVSLVRR